MIIELLLNLIYNLINLLVAINIPKLPDTVYGYFDQFFDYLVAGAGLLANYTPLAYLMTLFGIILAVDGGILIYHFIMWILRKIPVISVS